MLEHLLAEINNGGTLEIKSLAERLGTSPAMIEALLQHLARMGKLQIADTCQSDSCSGCSLSSACHSPSLKMWKTSPS